METYASGTWGRFYQALEESEAIREALEKEQESEESGERSLIKTFFTADQIKKIYLVAMTPDIEDNNERAAIVREILDPEFLEIGTGTNRLTVMRNQLIYKIALDRRGIIDNLTEFTRATEVPEYLARAYETNMLVLVSEYVTVMDLSEFIENEEGIREILSELSKCYIFDDLGFDKKNHMNWGYREDGDIVALDYGYLWPIVNKFDSLRCPKCGEPIRYNHRFTGFTCTNASCKATYRIMDMRRRCAQDMEEAERLQYADIMECDLPDISGVFKRSSI